MGDSVAVQSCRVWNFKVLSPVGVMLWNLLLLLLFYEHQLQECVLVGWLQFLGALFLFATDCTVLEASNLTKNCNSIYSEYARRTRK